MHPAMQESKANCSDMNAPTLLPSYHKDLWQVFSQELLEDHLTLRELSSYLQN